MPFALRSAGGQVYTWVDGDRTLRVRLQSDLVMLEDGTFTSANDHTVERISNGSSRCSVRILAF